MALPPEVEAGINNEARLRQLRIWIADSTAGLAEHYISAHDCVTGPARKNADKGMIGVYITPFTQITPALVELLLLTPEMFVPTNPETYSKQLRRLCEKNPDMPLKDLAIKINKSVGWILSRLWYGGET